MSTPVGVGIVGGTGYGAGELLRLLSQHPRAKTVQVVSRSAAGTAQNEHAHLQGIEALSLSPEITPAAFKDYQQKFLFLALPHEVSADYLAANQHLLEEFRVIDLSGALRLEDSSLHATLYPDVARDEALQTTAVYGLPELFAEQLESAQLIANPGCFATAAILAAAPLVGKAKSISLFGVTGSSGSGRSLKKSTHHPERSSNFFSYKALTHQHQPEIEQALAKLSSSAPTIHFIPHSGPFVRGIYLTLSAELATPVATEELRTHFRSFYAHAPFVRVIDQPPQLTHIVGTNVCELGVASDGTQVVVSAALDNLVKGMAGQAIQNMNICCGFEQETGLRLNGLGVF